VYPVVSGPEGPVIHVERLAIVLERFQWRIVQPGPAIANIEGVPGGKEGDTRDIARGPVVDARGERMRRSRGARRADETEGAIAEERGSVVARVVGLEEKVFQRRSIPASLAEP
jgi:hypothetical protein